MKQKISRISSNIESVEKIIKDYSIKKQDSIQKSMIRPLYQEVLKSIFLVTVILVDTLIPLEIFRVLPSIINIILSLIVFSIFLFVELHIYNLLWGQKGRWSLEKNKEISDKNKDTNN